jgi:hypothetical protein
MADMGNRTLVIIQNRCASSFRLIGRRRAGESRTRASMRQTARFIQLLQAEALATRQQYWLNFPSCGIIIIRWHRAAMPKETFITFLSNSPQGRVRYALGCLYFAGWIFLFVVGFGVGRHESASTTFSCPVLVNGDIFYYRPWIGWFLKHGPLTLVGVVPLAFLAEWFRWRKNAA